jgi:IS5 family transposase
VPWEDFRAGIEAVTETKPEQRKSNSGRKPYDTILKLKIVVLQSLHNLSDERTEYLIRDRISFMRFLDLELEDPVPDATTIWLFREALAQGGLIDRLFERLASISRPRAILRAAARSLMPRLCRCPSSARRRRRTRRSKPARRRRDGSSSPPAPGSCSSAISGLVLKPTSSGTPALRRRSLSLA